MQWRQTYQSGATAGRDHGGNLWVTVPDNDHPSRVRSAARIFARSVWGERADVTDRRGTEISLDGDGVQVTVRRYGVVVVGGPEDYSRALDRAENPRSPINSTPRQH